jgi:hypothetical protein
MLPGIKGEGAVESQISSAVNASFSARFSGSFQAAKVVLIFSFSKSVVVFTFYLRAMPPESEKPKSEDSGLIKCPKCGHEFYFAPSWIKASTVIGCPL